jgi:hypothetical protein
MLLAFLGESWSLVAGGGYGGGWWWSRREELVAAHGGYWSGEERNKPIRGFGFWVLYYY